MKTEQVDQALRQKFITEGERLVFWHGLPPACPSGSASWDTRRTATGPWKKVRASRSLSGVASLDLPNFCGTGQLPGW